MPLTTATDAKTQQQAVIADLITDLGPSMLDYADKCIQEAISIGQNKCELHMNNTALTPYLVSQLTTAGYRVTQDFDGSNLFIIWE